MPEIRPIKASRMRILFFRKMSLLMDGMDVGSRIGRIDIEILKSPEEAHYQER